METNTHSPLNDYLTKDELARELRRSTRTLDRWHTRRVGPPRTRAQKLILYKKGSSGFLVDVRSTPAPLCSFCGTGIDHCALA